LGGGSTGAGERGGGSGKKAKPSYGLRARSQKGFAYRGNQPLVSDPPAAELGIQTILQPALKNPPRLHEYLPLPNIVRPAVVASAEPARVAIKVKPGRLAVRRTDKPIVAPKITLPAATASVVNNLANAKASIPAKPVAKAPAPSELANMHASRGNERGLLVLNAVPPPPDVTTKQPAAEARSRFAIAPGDATVIAEPASGAVAGDAASSAAGNGSSTDLTSGDALAEVARGGKGSRESTAGSGTGSGGLYGSSKGSGLNATVDADGTGRGTATASGAGTGFGTRAGSGGGAGSATGGGGFPGMTIQGGQFGNGGEASLHARVARPTSYDMMIVATAGSGGGLPDLGVFHNEKVYTVYLDMRENDEDSAPSWTLQYAVLQPPATESGADASLKQTPGTPTPPYAMFKEIPQFAPEVLKKCNRQLVVASGIISAAGKLERLSVKRSPDGDIVQPLLEALSNWIFQPAQIDGKPVALKILLGIRLTPGH